MTFPSARRRMRVRELQAILTFRGNQKLICLIAASKPIDDGVEEEEEEELGGADNPRFFYAPDSLH